MGLVFLQCHLVSQGEVTLAPLQQQPCDVCVAPLGCEHQGRGSLAVLDVSVCAVAQQQANHHNSPVSHRQVQSCLARLWRGTIGRRQKMKILRLVKNHCIYLSYFALYLDAVHRDVRCQHVARVLLN